MKKYTFKFTPLHLETRLAFNTNEAAYYLNRAPQTLRTWASLQTGPIKPIHIGRRLGWRVADIRAILAEVQS